MSSEAISQVTEANVGMDTLASLADTSAEGANQHGLAGTDAEGNVQTPEEAAVGISASIDGEIATAAGLALDGDIEGARAAMGRANHTAQDQDADSHGPSQQYRGVRTPYGEIRSHIRNDRNLTGRERAAGVSATRAVHGATMAAIQSEGSARGLSDAAIAGAIDRFNGQ